jgi:hypothetical protein
MQGSLKGEKQIPYSAISAIQTKRPGIVSGYIQFTISGGKEGRKGLFEATSDENTLMFTDRSEFERAKEFIETKIRQSRSRPVEVTASEHSPIDQIEKLASLLDRGLLTRDEFDIQKAKILNSI